MDARFLMDHPRDRMIAAAIDGMRASGLAGAGINQVIAASGAPKGSLYHYFPGGKLALAQEALEHFGAQRQAELKAALSGDAPVDQKIKRLFSRMAKGLAQENFRFGCAVAGVSLDLGEEASALAPVCAALMESWTSTIADALEPLPAARRRALARFVVTAFEGALVQARASRSAHPVLEAGDQLAVLLRAHLNAL
ncbi:MAG TPA: TetR/AcrR family transcriptional regulator [Polaromonas sp.]|uniref:TetR/AcrR family transcriptional regulator n=1 Tax=Polaromonas sp. TaxID=1869339 RepID=UPI002D6BCA53|nr:TetR/AcrR family transcriptional regulator [Polaromonas sp.]HYW56750.1 TetR/AcrR family transcriptional regulator [Polaromonas sp.]